MAWACYNAGRDLDIQGKGYDPVYDYLAVRDAAAPARADSLHLLGETGRLARNIARNWLIGLRRSNPAIIDMFLHRDVRPYRELLPWSGEFAGKHITGACFIYRLTRDEALKRDALAFLRELLPTQDEDGYMGCFSRECRLTGAFSQNPGKSGETWDAWNHYHMMYGLLMWHEETGEGAYLAAAERIAGLFMRKFYGENPPLSAIGWCEMNLAVIHGFALLYEITEKAEYLRFAQRIEADLSSPQAGDYIHTALSGVEFYQCPKPRWESLHAILGVAELYAATGKAYYLDAVRQIVGSILKTDVHNTGAFSTDEQAIGHPYKNSNIETCCVVAFNALALRLFRLTGDAALLDYLERAHYNAMLGSFSPTGRWSTYNTPMEGFRRANFDSIQFQCRPGSPMLNCCSVNAPRGVGEAEEWLFTRKGGELCVNLYEAFEAEIDGLRLRCESDYPAPGPIRLGVENGGMAQRVFLRVPGWSKSVSCRVNGAPAPEAEEGYISVNISRGQTEVELSLDFSAHFLAGDRDYAGKWSVYSGPVLYGADAAHNLALCRERGLDDLPAASRAALTQNLPRLGEDGAILWDAGDLTLCDFYHLGASGDEYRTWLRVE